MARTLNACNAGARTLAAGSTPCCMRWARGAVSPHLHTRSVPPADSVLDIDSSSPRQWVCICCQTPLCRQQIRILSKTRASFVARTVIVADGLLRSLFLFASHVVLAESAGDTLRVS